MSILHLGTDAELLANRLAGHLERTARAHDFFVPTTVVVTHRSLARWLKLWLARHHGIAINLRVVYFENSLWEMLHEVDPRPQDPPPELLDIDNYRLLVLSILLDKAEPGLDFWRDYLLGAGPSSSRLFCRRAWQLADQLSLLIRDYEYHRQDALIQPWLKNELGLDVAHKSLEQAERAIFRAITREPGGKREQLNRAWQRNFKTFPQYAMDVMELYTQNDLPIPPKPLRSVHLFGLAQFSKLHAVTLRWLSRFFDIHLYHTNALASRLPQRCSRVTLQRLARQIVEPDKEPVDPGLDLLRAWGGAGAESLATMAHLASDARLFPIDVVSTPPRDLADDSATLFDSGRASVLTRLQEQVFHGTTYTTRVPQDRSLQIVACPGRLREIETVYHSVLANLEADATLRQSDIAIFVSDMNQYRPLVQAVFDRQPRRLRYNLSTFTAANVSTYAQAVIGMLDLALDSFTRSQVFAVLLNPCFLAKLGIERAQALIWLDWAEALGIYQGWDQADKRERGYADSPLFAWRLGLQRLRLGRIMETGRADSLEPLPRFGPVIPFADLNSGDPEQLNTFCLAVEGLLPRLGRLRTLEAGSAEWVAQLESLFQDFLHIPEDRPEEGQVRDRLFDALKRLLLWDHLGAEPPRLSLPLVQQMVLSVLETIEGAQGEFLAGGVTIASLQLFKPVPFRVVYVLGLCEDQFPGSNALSGLDLRGLKRLPGDIRAAEFHRYLFLEALLSARDKVYLLYHNLDAQKDQELHSSVPLQQLRRHVQDHLLDGPFVETRVPLTLGDDVFLHPGDQAKYTDVLVHFGTVDRLLAVEAGRRQGLELSAEQKAELDRRLEERTRRFTLESIAVPLARPTPTLRLQDLKKYLEFPVPAALKYHLHLQEEDDDEPGDDEPFVTGTLGGIRLMRQLLNHVVLRAVRTDAATALSEWPERFGQVYEEGSLCGQLPEEAFGEVDQAALRDELRIRIDESGGLSDFLRARSAQSFCGPVLIGESVTPVGARQRFPALELNLTRPLPQMETTQVRLVGMEALAWRDDVAFEILVWNFKKITKLSDTDLFPFLFAPYLFWLALRVGPTSADWLGDRVFRVHVAHAKGISSFEYLPSDVSPEEARVYLAELATDFLDPACFDLLPLDKIQEKPFRDAILALDEELGDLPGNFQQLFEDALADDADNPRRDWSTPLVDLVKARVPVDAFAKVRRRFRPLDRALRRKRDEGD